MARKGINAAKTGQEAIKGIRTARIDMIMAKKRISRAKRQEFGQNRPGSHKSKYLHKRHKYGQNRHDYGQKRHQYGQKRPKKA